MCNGDRVDDKIESQSTHVDELTGLKQEEEHQLADCRLTDALSTGTWYLNLASIAKLRDATGQPILLRTGTPARPIGCCLTRRMKIARICRPPTKTHRSKFWKDFLFLRGQTEGGPSHAADPRRDTKNEK